MQLDQFFAYLLNDFCNKRRNKLDGLFKKDCSHHLAVFFNNRIPGLKNFNIKNNYETRPFPFSILKCYIFFPTQNAKTLLA